MTNALGLEENVAMDFVAMMFTSMRLKSYLASTMKDVKIFLLVTDAVSIYPGEDQVGRQAKPTGVKSAVTLPMVNQLFHPQKQSLTDKLKILANK